MESDSHNSSAGVAQGSPLKKLNELKVTELKSELERRNLDLKGVKAVLIERLSQALVDEKQNPDEYLFDLGKSNADSTVEIVKKPIRHVEPEPDNEDLDYNEHEVDENGVEAADIVESALLLNVDNDLHEKSPAPVEPMEEKESVKPKDESKENTRSSKPKSSESSSKKEVTKPRESDSRLNSRSDSKKSHDREKVSQPDSSRSKKDEDRSKTTSSRAKSPDSKKPEEKSKSKSTDKSRSDKDSKNVKSDESKRKTSSSHNNNSASKNSPSREKVQKDDEKSRDKERAHKSEGKTGEETAKPNKDRDHAVVDKEKADTKTDVKGKEDKHGSPSRPTSSSRKSRSKSPSSRRSRPIYSQRPIPRGRGSFRASFSSFRGGIRGGIGRGIVNRGPYIPSSSSHDSDRSRSRYLRERERDEEDSRRKEIERVQREEREKLEREKERLRIDRERLEREKAEILRLERERARLEREKLEQEREMLRRQKVELITAPISSRLDDRHRPPAIVKRSYDSESSWDDRKRSSHLRHSSPDGFRSSEVARHVTDSSYKRRAPVAPSSTDRRDFSGRGSSRGGDRGRQSSYRSRSPVIDRRGGGDQDEWKTDGRRDHASSARYSSSSRLPPAGQDEIWHHGMDGGGNKPSAYETDQYRVSGTSWKSTDASSAWNVPPTGYPQEIRSTVMTTTPMAGVFSGANMGSMGTHMMNTHGSMPSSQTTIPSDRAYIRRPY